MFDVVEPLISELVDEADSAAANSDCSKCKVSEAMDEVNNGDNWVTTRWEYPKEMKDSRMPTLSLDAVLFVPKYDLYPIVEFSYERKESYGSPKELFHEYDKVTK